MLKPNEFKQSRETQIVYNLFRSITEREVPLVTWDEICEATGKRKHELNGPIVTAIRRVRRDDNMVIENDRGIGYRLCVDAEISNVAQRGIERKRRIERSSLEKVKCADTDRLGAEEKSRHFVIKSILEMGLATSRPRVQANVNQMILRKHNQLNEQEQMEAIKQAFAERK